MESSEHFAEKAIDELQTLSKKPLGNFKYSKVKEKSQNPDESDVYCCVVDDRLKLLHKAYVPDHVNSIFEVLKETTKFYPKKPFLCSRRKLYNSDGTYRLGEYVYKTYEESLHLAKAIGTALTSEKLVPETKIDNCKLIKRARFLGIWSVNCPYWLLTDYASTGYGFVTVPIYETLGDEALFNIMKKTKMETICIDSKKITNLENLFKETTQLKTVIVYDELTDEDKKRLRNLGLRCYLMDDLVEKYKDRTQDPPQSKRTDISTIIYTSGTSGIPKGAVFNNEGLLVLFNRLVNLHNRCNMQMFPKLMSFLPLAHVYERFIEHLICCLAGSIGYYSGNIKTVLEDVEKYKPTYLIGVPRVFTRILGKVRGELESKSFFVRKLVNFFLQGKKKVMATRPHNHAHWFYDLLLKKIKNKFGGDLDIMVLGSAAMTEGDITDVQGYLSTPMCEGWGTTELGVAILQDFRDPTKGTIGGPLYGIEFKLRSVQELGYDARGHPPRGELLVRGPGIMLGYFGDDKQTKEAFDDEGWYLTGDVVELLPNMALKILDRAKNFFKMSQGEYIAPDKLESAYANSKFVEQVYVHGDAKEDYLVGIVVVCPEYVEKWAHSHSLGNTPVGALLDNDNLIKAIEQDFEKIAKSQNFNSLERLKVFTLIDKPFTVEDGTLTPTFKSVRYKIKAKYNTIIKQMYGAQT